MITIFIMKKACKATLEARLLQGGTIALNRIRKELPASAGNLAIMSTPHGDRRLVTSRLYGNLKNHERFLGIVKFALDERDPEYTPAENCGGRAGDLRGTSLSMIEDRLKKVGSWPVSRK
ncbi:hypothetical protein HYPSUDRAFT_207271 [Hypholoma sublateritium FD-334 SS-4]|uniref:Uncharacterized protein n=1 Tax=Hypholoma sublateritium (strain FD-334 SS-4) TaxID=945553 RepID=A0A0D2P759_HYPSF|nr:hypothetical protein HYPSUDRAFT_207271 [Hypholoma sublateritium FD-334 SS-4]